MSGRTAVLLVILRSSSVARAMSVSGWTSVAIKATKTLAINQREKLDAAGALGIERPVIIKAERIETAEQMMRDEDAAAARTTDTKIIHFQRHGQGYHNLIGDVWRELKIPLDLDSTDAALNPFLRQEIVDSPLTEAGRQQSMARREEASLLNPQAVIVSPLLRAIQTALLSFSSHRNINKDGEGTKIPWIAHEGTREEMGLLLCNKRRALSDIRQDFPEIDFSNIVNENDENFSDDRRETVLEMSERVYDFLVEYVRNRPESEMAVVGHSAWLFNMCNAVVDCGDDEDLRTWFLTSEIRSMKLTFTDRDQVAE